MFSSQEELGTRGAKIGAFSKGVDEFICVDVSFAYTPNCDKADCREIGKGAMIGFSPILDKNISKSSLILQRKIIYRINAKLCQAVREQMPT